MFARISSFATLFGFILLSITLAGCRGGKTQSPSPPPPAVTVAIPISYPVVSYTYFNGHLDAIDSVEVRARVKGILRAKYFTEGAEVKQGKVLYQIDDREYKTGVRKAEADVKKAEADALNWKAQLARDESELKRVIEQLNKGVGVPADKDKAVASVEVDKAQIAVAVANKDAAESSQNTAEIQLGYTKISAEIDGRVSRTQVSVGNLVGQNETTLLTTIVRMDKLYVYFDAPERDFVTYQKLLKLKGETELPSGGIPVEIGVATETGYPHLGVIEFRENRIDQGSGTIRIRGTLENPDRLLYPGLYARVRIPSGPPQPQLLIPEAALMTGQEGRYVYVIKDGNTAEKRTVVPGTKVGPLIAIEKGLTATDQVVVKGLQSVRPGSPVEPKLEPLAAPESVKK